eukprot:3549820-Rhodomonas_salina.1
MLGTDPSYRLCCYQEGRAAIALHVRMGDRSMGVGSCYMLLRCPYAKSGTDVGCGTTRSGRMES